jgi:DNA-binding transcriptional regulator YiaG
VKEKDALLIIEARAAARSGRLLQVLEDSGLGPVDWAAVLGVSPSTVSRWATGERMPRGPAAIRLARFLAVLEARVGSNEEVADAL